MKIRVEVNGKTVLVEKGKPLDSLMNELNITMTGTALAVNEDILPSNEWNKFLINEEVKISVFRAIAGG